MSQSSPKSLKRWRPLEWLAAAAVVVAIGATATDSLLDSRAPARTAAVASPLAGS
jgi:hypothetical protein